MSSSQAYLRDKMILLKEIKAKKERENKNISKSLIKCPKLKSEYTHFITNIDCLKHKRFIIIDRKFFKDGSEQYPSDTLRTNYFSSINTKLSNINGQNQMAKHNYSSTCSNNLQSINSLSSLNNNVTNTNNYINNTTLTKRLNNFNNYYRTEDPDKLKKLIGIRDLILKELIDDKKDNDTNLLKDYLYNKSIQQTKIKRMLNSVKKEFHNNFSQTKFDNKNNSANKTNKNNKESKYNNTNSTFSFKDNFTKLYIIAQGYQNKPKKKRKESRYYDLNVLLNRPEQYKSSDKDRRCSINDTSHEENKDEYESIIIESNKENYGTLRKNEDDKCKAYEEEQNSRKKKMFTSNRQKFSKFNFHNKISDFYANKFNTQNEINKDNEDNNKSNNNINDKDNRNTNDKDNGNINDNNNNKNYTDNNNNYFEPRKTNKLENNDFTSSSKKEFTNFKNINKKFIATKLLWSGYKEVEDHQKRNLQTLKRYYQNSVQVINKARAKLNFLDKGIKDNIDELRIRSDKDFEELVRKGSLNDD